MVKMRERIKPTRSGLFAIELLISVGIFTLCAAVCVGLFVRSELMSRDSAELNRAVTEARSAAECFKAAGGDLEETARLTGGEVSGNTLLLRYDEGFALTLQAAPGDGYTSAVLSARRLDTGEALLVWDIAALEVAS